MIYLLNEADINEICEEWAASYWRFKGYHDRDIPGLKWNMEGEY